LKKNEIKKLKFETYKFNPRGESMNQEQMKNRTKEFAKQIIKLCRQLPETREGRLIGNQIFRSGTSVGSNYHAVCRDETLYWLELIVETKIMEDKNLNHLMKEADELAAIFVASLNKAKSRK
jgi:hypothetical protein